MQDVGKLILRLTTGGLILFNGIAKLIHGVSRIGDMLAASTFLPSLLMGSISVRSSRRSSSSSVRGPELPPCGRGQHDCGYCSGGLPQGFRDTTNEWVLIGLVG